MHVPHWASLPKVQLMGFVLQCRAGIALPPSLCFVCSPAVKKEESIGKQNEKKKYELHMLVSAHEWWGRG